MQFRFSIFWQRAQVPARASANRRPSFCAPYLLSALPLLLTLVFSPSAHAQDTGTAETEFRGNGVVITIVVHALSGEPLSSPAIVKLFRGGTIPSGQAETSRGRAELVVNNLGDFTVNVQAAGY